MLEYHAAYYPVEDGWYMARLLDFPGVITQGKTLQSARRMLRSALREMAEWYLEDGQSFPAPNPRAKDQSAELQEKIRLGIRVQSGAGS